MKKTWRVYPNTVLLYWYFSTIEESKKTTILKVNKFRLTFIRVTISKIVRRQHLVKVQDRLHGSAAIVRVGRRWEPGPKSPRLESKKSMRVGSMWSLFGVGALLVCQIQISDLICKSSRLALKNKKLVELWLFEPSFKMNLSNCNLLYMDNYTNLIS